jgi:hypothetical protein
MISFGGEESVQVDLIWIGDGENDLAVLKLSTSIAHGYLLPYGEIFRGSIVFA